MSAKTTGLGAACIYCGCTEDRACQTPQLAFEEEMLAQLQALYAVDDATDLPDPIPCHWVQEDPPVCSAPGCVARLRAGAPGRGSEGTSVRARRAEASARQPMRLRRWATMFRHEGEWEHEGAQSVVLWEPLDSDAPADAHASIGLGQSVRFYDRTRDRFLGEAHYHQIDCGGDSTLLLIGAGVGAAWYEIGCAEVRYRDDHRGWYVRWLGYRNTRTARAANAMLLALHHDDGRGAAALTAPELALAVRGATP